MSRGRKTLDGAIVRRVQVTLDDETVERAKALGDGNLSQGIREAVRERNMLMLTITHKLHDETITSRHVQIEGEWCGETLMRARDIAKAQDGVVGAELIRLQEGKVIISKTFQASELR